MYDCADSICVYETDIFKQVFFHFLLKTYPDRFSFGDVQKNVGDVQVADILSTLMRENPSRMFMQSVKVNKRENKNICFRLINLTKLCC